jgi:hypothetical protein
VHDYVFCADCEQRFNEGGERYFISLVADGRRFPLRDKLSTMPVDHWGSFLVLSGARAGVDTAKIGHFATGLVWKAAVHEWHTFAGQTTRVRPLPNMEAVRRYLVGESPMPPDMLVFAVVCLDGLSHSQIMAPYLIGGFEAENRYEMLIKGIKLQVAISPPEDEIRNLCCVHAQIRPIFASNCHDATLESARHFHKTAHRARNLP